MVFYNNDETKQEILMEDSISDQEDDHLQTTKEYELMDAINKKKENLAYIEKVR